MNRHLITKILRVIILGFLILFPTQIFSRSNIVDAQKKETKRRLLILGFVNHNNVQEQSYLTLSIPEALLNSLRKSNRFEVISLDDSEEIISREGYKVQELYSERNAVKIGSLYGIDVVIIGNFVIVNTNIRIEAKAVDVATGQVRIVHNQVAKTDSSIFASIERLAQDMTHKLAARLPPMSETEIQNRKPFTAPSRRDSIFSFAGTAAVPMAQASKFINTGAGVILGYEDNFWARFRFNFNFGFFLPSGILPSNDTKVFSITSGIAYPLRLWNHLIMQPVLGLGVNFGTVNAGPMLAVPVMNLGIENTWFFSQNLGLRNQLVFSYLFDADLVIIFFNLSLGVTYRL